MARGAPWTLALLAAAMLLAAGSPCAARGTGGFLRDWVAGGPLEGTRIDEPALPGDFVGFPGLFALGRVWLPVQAEPEGRIDLRALYPESRSGTALLHTFVEVPADGTYHLRIGSDDAVRVDVDGRTVHRNDLRRAWAADQDNVKVTLTRGWHRVLVRVIDYGGDWAASVRVADAKDQPIDLPHQAACPPALERDAHLDEAVTLGERVEVAKYLTRQVARLQADLEGALPRLSQMPEGYVTFAEYEGARHLGLMFFEAMAAFWREAANEPLDAEAVRAAQHMAVVAARGFSEVIAQETDRMGQSLVRHHTVWETLGGKELSRRNLADATLQIGDLIAQTRRLAGRIENERLLTARFENDIRNWRQRDVAVRVLDPEGGPVSGAEVEIVQTQHDFLFGCNLFAFGRWDDARKNELYERRFRGLFNFATLPIYWSVIERKRDRPEFDPVDAAIRWCRKEDIQVRAHPLFWQEAVPRWAESMKPDEARAAAEAWVRRTVERCRDTVAWWDVVQQPGPALRVAGATLDPADLARWAVDAKPQGRLLVNGDDADALAASARRIKAAGVRLDGVGLAAHQHEGDWPLDQVQSLVARCAEAGVPVHVSAVTILGGPENEAQQAEAVRHFYTAAFAHPKVASITWWDLSDQFAWKNAPAGLLRADLSPKPAYEALDRLINHLWRTDAAGRTGDDGKVTVRAFFGRYRITVRRGGRTATADVRLARDGPAEVEVVLPPAK